MNNGEIGWLAFTKKGRALAETLCTALGGEVSCTRDGVSLSDWTAWAFFHKRALVFVGAAGIAVRAIAPYIRSKANDPAVVALDECGRYAVVLLSGHLGGANELAEEIGKVCGAEAVITTATDRSGVFAFDSWARKQGMAVADPGRIKRVSLRLLEGEGINVRSAFPIGGKPPEGVRLTESGDADVWVDVRVHEALTLVPPVLALGIGCRRGIRQETLEQRFAALCEETDIVPQAIYTAASIDLKRGERGLEAFCETHGWPLAFYSAAELEALEGAYSASDFVRHAASVDNVCERAAVKCVQGELILKKFAGEGVTFALAQRMLQLDWGIRND